ncbi:hypothetical protein FACS1894109_09150 [Spirochaetia bacterium]|nr:hypothetical protein FACS1894109_09150 [Spirochaetia bacterium]
MDGVQTIRLELRSPLFYQAEAALVPFQYETGEGELLFCFDLDPVQGRSIEPEATALLGPLVFAGRATALPTALPSGSPENRSGEAGRLELPAGNYLFAQERRTLNKQEFIEMAVEVQKDGLWERLAPAGRLYLRYLFEDGQTVTQVFRPY